MDAKTARTADADPSELANGEKKRFRYTVDLPLHMESKLTELSGASGEPRTEVIRRALLLYFKCEDLKRQGFETGGFREQADGSVRLVTVVA